MRTLLTILLFAMGCQSPVSRLYACRKGCKIDKAIARQAVRIDAMAILVGLRRLVGYKYVVDPRGILSVAPLPASHPAAPRFTHAALAGGTPVLAAGYLTVQHDGREVSWVQLDNRSYSYCPRPDSLTMVTRLLQRAGVTRNRFRLKRIEAVCKSTPPKPG